MLLRAPDSTDAVESGASAEDTERSASPPRSPPTPPTVVPPRLHGHSSVLIGREAVSNASGRSEPVIPSQASRSQPVVSSWAAPPPSLVDAVYCTQEDNEFASVNAYPDGDSPASWPGFVPDVDLNGFLTQNLDGSSAALDGVTWTSLGSTHGVSPGHAFVSSTGAASGLGSGLDIGVPLPLDGLTSGVASGIDSSLVGSSRRGAALSTPLNSSAVDEVTTTRRSTFTFTSSSSSATPNASQRDVQCLFLHNDHGFRCPLCNAWFPAWAGMRLHRISDHPKIKFTDRFTAACSCSTFFPSRLAALNHASSCAPAQAPQTQQDPVQTTAIPRSRLSVWTNFNDTQSLVATPQLASHIAASGGADSPPSLTLTPTASLPTDSSTTVPNFACSTCSRTFPSKRSLSAHAYRCQGETTSANKQPRVNTVSPAPQLVQPPSTPHDYILRFDGSCLGNGLTSSDPPCGAGAALFAPDGTVIWSLSSYLPPPTNSNNTAEYKALLAGLIGALHWRPRRLVIEGDSRLVIDQVLGRARCKTLALRPLRNNALALLRRLRSHDIDYSFRHIERNFNSVADGLAKDGATDRATTCECACPSPGTTCVPSAHLSPTPQLRSMDMIWCMENEQLVDRALYVHRRQPASYDMDVTEPSPPSIMDRTAGTRDPQTAHAVVMDTNATPHTMSLDTSSTSFTAAPQPLEEYTQTRPISDTSDMDTTSPLDQDVAASAEPPTDAVGQPATQDSTATPSPNPHTALSDDMDVSVPEPAHTSHSPQRTQRARRLHLPSNIAQHKLEAAQASLRRMVEQWTAAIDDDDTWTSTGRTLDELPSILTQLVHSLSSGENPTASAPSTSAPLTSNQSSPCEPRAHTHRRSTSGPRRQSRLSQRIDNAIHDLHTTEKSTNRNRIQHARRRVSRLKRAQSRLDLRELFNRSPAKCVDQILRPVLGELVVSRCEIPITQLEAHFTAVHRPSCEFDAASPLGSLFTTVLSTMPPATAMSHSLSDAITTDEIETALDTCRLDSAPGLDGIPYRILYKFRLTLLPYLTAAFNSCWTHKRIPQGWKQSVTELIHKKGDPMDPSNWRPLALQSTLYKLYITVVKSRFSTWLECNNRFNNAQKGFRAFNGCHEHNFLSQSVMDTTRRKAKPLFVVWYDLRNAFGSIPQSFLWFVFSKLGVPEPFIQLLRDVYSDASTMVSTKDGLTQPIAQHCGVFQGCPLSPLLFIAGMIPLIEALQQHAPTHGVELSSGNFTAVTAFADDIKIYSRSADGITKLHDIISRFLSWTTMAANPNKCALLAVDCINRKHIPAALELTLDGTPIPHLTWDQAYTYLGIREGFDATHARFQLTPKLRLLRKQIVALAQSGLAPWQVVKAVKMFVLSQLDYGLRHVRATKTEMAGFTAFLYRCLRQLLRLPRFSCNDFFAAPATSGGLGLLPLDEHKDALVLSHAFQMLHSIDDSIQSLAREQLRHIVHTRYLIDPKDLDEGGDLLLQHYLNGTIDSLPGILPRRSHNDVASLWTDVARILQRYKLQFHSSNGQHFMLSLPHMDKPVTSATVARHTKLHLKNIHADAWTDLKDQGRTVPLHGDLGSRFIPSGGHLHDSEYCFAFAARLNLVETRSVMKRHRMTSNDRCRHCGSAAAETLAHALQICPHNEVPIRYRHDASLEAITAAIRKRNPTCNLLVNSTMPGFPGDALRPDIQLLNETKKQAIICDLAIVFEHGQLHDGKTVFEQKAASKRSKYQPLSRHLVSQGYEVFNCALVYGALGSVAPDNKNILCGLFNLGRHAARSLESQLSADHIKASRRIWRYHCRNRGTSVPGGASGGTQSQRS